jgi:hypothetical protein
MSVTLRTPIVALAATAACDLCPLSRAPAPTAPRARVLPQVRFSAAVLGSMVVGAGFWSGVAYLAAKTFF